MQNTGNNHLENYCVINSLKGKSIKKNDAIFLEKKLWNDGLNIDLTPNINIKKDKNNYQAYIYPSLNYIDNINAGNPKKNLTIGNLVFEGSAENVKKSGVMPAINIGFNNKYHSTNNTTLKTNLTFNYSHDITSDLTIKTLNASTCLDKYIKNQLFIKPCARYYTSDKKLQKYTKKNLSFTVAKIFSSKNKSTFNEISFKADNNIFKDDKQMQYSFEFNSINSKNNKNYKFGYLKGEPIDGKHMINNSFYLEHGFKAFNRFIKIMFKEDNYDGSKFFGIDRKDKASALTLTFPMNHKIQASIGMYKNFSNLDYYTYSTPTINFQIF